MKRRDFFVYIMASFSGTLYIGVTSGLERRVWEHKEGVSEGFTKKYHCTRLVYYEHFDNIEAAIAREKQLKKWSRKKKETLIRKLNPKWKDLSKDWYKRDSSPSASRRARNDRGPVVLFTSNYSWVIPTPSFRRGGGIPFVD